MEDWAIYKFFWGCTDLVFSLPAVGGIYSVVFSADMILIFILLMQAKQRDEKKNLLGYFKAEETILDKTQITSLSYSKLIKLTS